jgi:diketogulonate reductase-like aldo/keto reductase
VDTLEAMLSLQKKGMTRHIGVSNFVRFHLEQLEPYHFPILTNQIEMHPYLQRKPIVETCKKMGIKVTAYRPLAKGAFEQDATMQKIGKKYGKTPSQIALRWLVQQDIAVIPKAANLQHLKDNIDIFDFNLNDKDMLEIDKLDSGRRYCDPEGMPVYED